MKSKTGKPADPRISFTIHLRPEDALLADAAAARACTTRHSLMRDLLLGHVSENMPMLACLAQLIAIHHRLDNVGVLDDEFRKEILKAVRELIATARAEVGG